MAGSIQDRGNGSYLLAYHIGYDAKGKRIRKTRTIKAKNKTEARKMLAAFITEVEKGEYISPSNTKLHSFVEAWRKKAEKQLAPKTLEMYNYLLEGRVLPAFSHLHMEDISHVFIAEYMEGLESDGLASSTVQKHYNLLNGIFKLALDNELIKTNPMDKVDKPKVTYKPGDVYNSEELKRLYHLLNKEEIRHAEDSKNAHGSKQQVLIVKLALQTGMRKGEILALQWEDVDFSTNTINIRHSLSYTKSESYQLKEPKTKGSKRKVAPPKTLMEELKRHIYIKKTDRMEAKELWQDGRYNFVFSTDLGKALHQNVPDRWWRRFLDRINKELEKEDQQPLKKIRFHDLRHTAATNLINKGANIHSISKRLGHANITTTLNIYGHYLEEADQMIADMLDEDYI